MDVHLLGPIEARLDDRPIALGPGKQRAVLAMLALKQGRTVPADRLAEGLWGERFPPSAAKMVQLYVSHLRRLLRDGGAEIVTRGRGYELRLGEGDVDVLRFEQLLEEARPREALALWRGEALADVADEPFAAVEIRRLEELRVRAAEEAIEADLAAGLHRERIGELDALVAANPLRETLHAQRILALYRCGRQADALEAYRDARGTLVEQIGVEPGPNLRQLHEAILRQDAALEAPGPAELARTRSPSRPARMSPVSTAEPAASKQGQTAPTLAGEHTAGSLQRLLDSRAGELVGRGPQRAELLRLLDPRGPIVSFVWGQAGVGKSALLRAFSADAAARGAAVVELDGGTIEPSEVGFLAGLSRALEMELANPMAACEAIGARGQRVVVTLDGYERLRPLDDWLRATWMPVLPDHVRVAIAGRDAPVAAWSQYGPLVAQFGLDSLPPSDAVELLRQLGVPADRAVRFNRVLRGHPLSLHLVASCPSSVRGADDAALRPAFEELNRLFLADLDQDTRRALDAASVVRRVTLSLLSAMIPESAPTDTFARLRCLPFVWSGSEGLIVFHVVRSAIAAQLRSADPATYRRLRAAAWQQLRSELRRAPPSQLWRYGADMLYLSESAGIRDAFFPNTAPFYEVGPATPQDGPAIEGISRHYEGPAAVELLRAWWQAAPDTFTVARAQDSTVAGYSTVCEPSAVNPRLHERDPITAAWRAHLRDCAPPRDGRALYLRHLLTAEGGEAPVPAQAALLLDLTRRYLDMRSALRRVYACARNPADAAPRLVPLGFVPLDGPQAEIDAVTYHAYVLDFDRRSADDWLAELTARDVEIDGPTATDAATPELTYEPTRSRPPGVPPAAQPSGHARMARRHAS
jgi:DNA-binding SARP family transcriptional activator